MNNRYPTLMSPKKVGNTWYKNRIISCPMTLHAMQDGNPYPNEAVIRHFVNKARGGAAVVTIAGVSIKPATQDRVHAEYSAYDPEAQKVLAQLVDQIHFYNAKASVQIGLPPMSTESSVCAGIPMFVTGKPSKEMQPAEMEQLAADYAAAADEMVKLGFDTIMLHFGHGMLVAQFMSPHFNRCSDEYGGSVANRARFPMMILKAIRDRIGTKALLEVRLSGQEFEENGLQIDECIEFIKLFQQYIDLVQVSAGTHYPRWMARVHPTGLLPPMPNAQFARAVKACPDIHIAVEAMGGIQEPEAAERFLAEGGADFVAIARGIIADPELPNKLKRGRGEDIMPCLKCLHCHDSAVYGHHYVCAVNPLVGFEHAADKLIPAPGAGKRVVVIGGGPAGMEAALTAAGRGHAVTLLERSGALGGALKFTDYVSFKYDLRRYKDHMIAQTQAAGIDLRLNTEATPEFVASLGADTVIVALGASPAVPPIPGRDGANVRLAVDIYGDEAALGQRVAIIGGGQIGCETGLHLRELGREVTVLEMQAQLAADAYPTYRQAMLFRMEEDGVGSLTGVRVTGITAAGVDYTDAEGRAQCVAADTVLLATGMRADYEQALRYLDCAETVLIAGDCKERAGDVEKAMRTGFEAGVNA